MDSPTRFTPLSLLAALSVLAFCGVAGFQGVAGFRAKTAASTYVAPTPTAPASAGGASWQQEMMLLGLATSTGPGVDDGTDPIAMIGPEVLGQLLGSYQGLQQAGTYSTSTGAAAAELIANNVRANVVYQPYDGSEIATDQDSSYDRMLRYQSDMQTALKPLLDNKKAEYELFGSYVATGDRDYLRQLQDDANNYENAAHAAAALVVPADISGTHVELLNAMLQFSATVSALAAHADDPVATMALLRAYNDAETNVVSSFDKIAQYEHMKQP